LQSYPELLTARSFSLFYAIPNHRDLDSFDNTDTPWQLQQTGCILILLECSAVAIQMCNTGTASTTDAVGLAGELNKRTRKQFAQTIHYKSAFQKLPTQFYWRMNFTT
jgi:hypothetical protein